MARKSISIEDVFTDYWLYDETEECLKIRLSMKVLYEGYSYDVEGLLFYNDENEEKLNIRTRGFVDPRKPIFMPTTSDTECILTLLKEQEDYPQFAALVNEKINELKKPKEIGDIEILEIKNDFDMKHYAHTKINFKIGNEKGYLITVNSIADESGRKAVDFYFSSRSFLGFGKIVTKEILLKTRLHDLLNEN